MRHIHNFDGFLNEKANFTQEDVKNAADFLNSSAKGLGTNEDGFVGSIQLIKGPEMMVAVNQLMSKGGYAYKTVGQAIKGEMDFDDGYYKGQIESHLKSVKADKHVDSVSMPTGPAKPVDVIAAIKPRVKQHEGVKPKVYKDTKGIPTVGVGFNLKRKDADAVLKSVGANPKLVKSGKQALSDVQIDKILVKDLVNSKSSMERVIPGFASMPADIQGVLIEMNFNLGTTGLLEFKNFLNALKVGNYQQASKEMLTSSWAKQVGGRAKVLADVVAKA